MIDHRWNVINEGPKDIIVYGGGDQGRVDYPILEQLGYRVRAFVDDTPGMFSPVKGIPILQGLQKLRDFLMNSEDSMTGFVLAIGNPYGHVRIRLHNALKSEGLHPISFADPTALICKSATFSAGLQVMTSAIVERDVKIGRQCIINTRALITHDCELGDGVEIAPGAVLCGRVKVGENSWIGANACVRQKVVIGNNSIVGAGSVVVSDVPDNVIVVGAPARFLKSNFIKES